MITSERKARYQVVCVCGGYGFPLGNASSARIIMVGKALQEGGIGMHLLHCGPDPFGINRKRSGVHEGISFQYTTSVRRPGNRFARWLVYLWAMIELTVRLVRLWPVRHSMVVYLYHMDGTLNLYTGALCRLLRLPVVQELCEWFPGEPGCSALTKWLYKKRFFDVATGTLVISSAIEKRVKERSEKINPDLLIYRLPTIVDARQFAAGSSEMEHSEERLLNFVYCGTWMNDIRFILRAFGLVKLSGLQCKLKIVGAAPEKSAPEILEYGRKQGLLPGEIVFTGCIDEPTLETCYKTAGALLMPLWKDDRSLTRLPNKLGGYLASGRPVITSSVGDLTDFLADKVNAYVGEPGNERDFADRMIAVLRDPHEADRIGAAGQQACFAHLDYRSHITGLADFFIRCIESYKARIAPKEHFEMRRDQTFL